MNLAAQYCDRLYVIKDGRIVKEGTPNEVITENMIREIYNVRATVSRHPATGLLNVVYYPGFIATPRQKLPAADMKEQEINTGKAATAENA